MISEIKRCRSCGSKSLDKVIDLGEQYFSGYFPDLHENIEHLRAPLILDKCNECSLVQIRHSFSLSQMYGENYGYRSGLNSSMVHHLSLKAKLLIEKYGIDNSSNVLDIGSNDGTFLRNFSTVGSQLTAIDPTIPNWISYYDYSVKLIDKFFDENILNVIEPKFYDLITSISIYYDVPMPVDFAMTVKKLLSPEGIWHIELSYLPFMLENRSFDTICHEHLEYYSISSLQYIFTMANLKIIDIGFNRINGGSIHLDVAHVDSHYKSKINLVELISREIHKIDHRSWDNFRFQINRNIEQIKNSIYQINESGDTVVGIGASTKGNIILQAAQLNPKLITFIGEINERKFGKVTPGTRIPIVPDFETQGNSIRYKLILPWHFKNHIIENNKDFLARGGKLIFPIPNYEMIGKI